ncbi:alpha/beta fold hydrolase [Sphingomonas sp. MAH-20]|uniref:Alpha/beta fold hydrolase n=1 Tax=Sphingomonas horti TaxID=2682842 RepID=A0A6I4IYX6_9SPHN|nr:alpha/beta hydrolase [Sphingomonas sp. CGMCC 1.13658]MBA2918380.1 alpha/beta hydrolase [Sphingomonas sp. CGMCC 1.13658]MVO77347.1 alpha/beta fold hydrolase [Sphingomonas horti]
MADFADEYWTNDGLRLHYRDYAGGGDGRPVILCLPGLTRNVRDFAALAERLAPAWRVIAIDFRGRGESAYSKEPASYAPLTYAQDVKALLDELALDAIIPIGTSLGGLVTMLLAATDAQRVKGVVFNDVGPEVEPAGIARIRSYVGRSGNWPTWLHAARSLAANQRHVYPNYGIEDWLRMAKRLYRLSGNGRIVIDYDPRISEPMRNAIDEPAPDLWPLLTPLKDVPALILRGELSDVLSTGTVRRMLAALPRAEAVTVPRVGHAPTLEEAAAAEAIDRLLAAVLEAGAQKEPAG